MSDMMRNIEGWQKKESARKRKEAAEGLIIMIIIICLCIWCCIPTGGKRGPTDKPVSVVVDNR